MNLLIKLVATGIISLSVLLGGVWIGKEQVPVAGSFTPVQASQFPLAGAGVTSLQTNITLSSFKLPDPNKTPITMSMFGAIGYGVLEPQTSKIENVTFTGVTQNSNGSATLTGVSRGISFYTPFAASTTLSLAHAGGSYFILSNSAAFYGQQFLFANNTGSSTATITYSNTSPPFYYPGPGLQSTGTYNATSSEFASVAYVNQIAFSGVNNATEAVKGISQFATQLQQAASSFLGSTGAGLVLQARYATSTPIAGLAGNDVVVTNTSGFINPLFIATSSVQAPIGYVWTASSTFNGTTTILGNSLTINPFKINNLTYAWPALHATSGVLTDDGQGNLSWGGIPHYVLSSNTNFGSAGIYSTSTILTIPQGFMTASSTIHVRFNYQCQDATAADGQCNYYIRAADGTTFATMVSSPPSSGGIGNNRGFIDAIITPVNSVSSQITIVAGVGTYSQTAGYLGDIFGDSTDYTSSVNMANAFGIAIVSQGTNAHYTPVVFNYSIEANK